MKNTSDRIAKFGEVFTPEQEVNAMLDLVKQETQRIDSRFLEPACGDGNFLAAILDRKIAAVIERYSKNQLEFEKYIFLSVSSIYGVDILIDNVNDCRLRLYEQVTSAHENLFKKRNEKFYKTIMYVLETNILHGDALTLKSPINDKPIIFSEWSLVTRNKVKRADYTLSNLLAYQPFDEDTLFSDLGEKAFIPIALKKYPLVDFLEISHAYD